MLGLGHGLGQLMQILTIAVTGQAVATAREQALEQIQQQLPVARVSNDGVVSLDLSDADERQAFVDSAVPEIEDELAGGGGLRLGARV